MLLLYFGASKRILSDNGGKFNVEGSQQMNEKLNIETCAIAAKS